MLNTRGKSADNSFPHTVAQISESQEYLRNEQVAVTVATEFSLTSSDIDEVLCCKQRTSNNRKPSFSPFLGS